MRFSGVKRSGTSPSVATNSIREPTGIASPGATSHRLILITEATRIDPRIIHAVAYNATAAALRRRPITGTLLLLMIAASSSTEVLIRVAVALGCAAVALILATKIKPSTPDQSVLVPVQHKPTPLYRQPDSDERLRSAGRLAGGAVLAGALLACFAGFAIAIALGLINNALG